MFLVNAVRKEFNGVKYEYYIAFPNENRYPIRISKSFYDRINKAKKGQILHGYTGYKGDEQKFTVEIGDIK